MKILRCELKKIHKIKEIRKLSLAMLILKIKRMWFFLIILFSY